MPRIEKTDRTGAYALATGEAAAHRLRILHNVYGPGTRRVLLAAGLGRGMRASADDSVLAVMPRMTQVWARKPVL
jgi:hypothetical protein